MESLLFSVEDLKTYVGNKVAGQDQVAHVQQLAELMALQQSHDANKLLALVQTYQSELLELHTKVESQEDFLQTINPSIYFSPATETLTNLCL